MIYVLGRLQTDTPYLPTTITTGREDKIRGKFTRWERWRAGQDGWMMDGWRWEVEKSCGGEHAPREMSVTSARGVASRKRSQILYKNKVSPNQRLLLPRFRSFSVVWNERWLFRHRKPSNEDMISLRFFFFFSLIIFLLIRNRRRSISPPLSPANVLSRNHDPEIRDRAGRRPENNRRWTKEWKADEAKWDEGGKRRNQNAHVEKGLMASEVQGYSS